MPVWTIFIGLFHLSSSDILSCQIFSFFFFFKLNLCTIGYIHGYEKNSEVHIITFSVFAFTGDIVMTLFTKHPCLQ